jgi:DNA-binding XRE family transcriptional regulator
VLQRMRERRCLQLLDQPPECGLVGLRKSAHRTQLEVAAALGVRQVAVSRLERRRDLRLSTLSAYVGALGGDLQLIVRFPHRAVRLVWL